MNSLPNLKGKGLFVFSDPGGAKPILALIKSLGNRVQYRIISDRRYDFYDDFGLNVDGFFSENEMDLINNFKPDFVFTATSYTSQIEVRFIAAAKELKIPTYTFVDHYTNYLERFQMNGTSVFPDKLFLTDKRAYDIAVASGLRENCTLEISGNPFHEYLRQWKPKLARAEVFAKLGLPKQAKLIIFAPDPITNAGGKEKYGFDELDVLTILMNAKKAAVETTPLIIRAHPNQDRSQLILGDWNSNELIFGDSVDANTLIFYADMIVGMYSSFLVEASLFSKKIIRLLPKQKLLDSLSGMNIGMILTTQEHLTQELLRS